MDLYLKTQRCRYRRGNRAVKKRILDAFCETHGYHRKAAARLLRQAPISDKTPQKLGKKKRYKPDILLEALKKIGLNYRNGAKANYMHNITKLHAQIQLKIAN